MPVILLTLLCVLGLAAESTTVSLHADHRVLTAGGEASLVLRVVPPPGWHVYWRNPGDSGLPTTISWTLPAGVSLGEAVWPVPQRFEDAGGALTFGHQDELLVSVPLRIADDRPAGPIQLQATVEWLACREACMFGQAKVALDLQVGQQAVGEPAGARLLARAVAEQPASAAPWRVTAQIRPERIVLDLHPLRADSLRPERLRFFPVTEGVIASGRPQHWRPDPLPQLILTREPGRRLPARLEGLLVVEEDGRDQAWAIAVPLIPTPGP